MIAVSLGSVTRSVIIITGSGYIKRIPIKEFEAQSRGGKGKLGTKLSTEEDVVSQFFSCNDHDVVLFITDRCGSRIIVLLYLSFSSSSSSTCEYRGVAYSLKAFQIPLCSRIAKGVPVAQVLPTRKDGETVTSVIPVDKFGEEESLILLTSRGFVKRTPLKVITSC